MALKRKRRSKKWGRDLTPHQLLAFESVYERLHEGHRYTLLQGYAGTGKTHLVARLIARLKAEDADVAVCAPTHKAAQVLRERIDVDGVATQTIHSFLGLKLVPDRQGGYRLAMERGKSLPSGAVVVVDEASMLGAQEWSYVEQALELQWVFVGDPAQLPPVKERASPVFHLPGPTLEEVVRQAQGNPIIDLATQVRHGAFDGLDAHFDGSVGVAATSTKKAFIDSALRAFDSDEFRSDGTFARLLAYRNATVRDYNRQVRRAIYGQDVPRFTAGEWLVARETWYQDDTPYLINSEEVRVLAADEGEDFNSETGAWKVWGLFVESRNDAPPRQLLVLHEREEERFAQELASLKRAAIREEKDWKLYYALRERFAQVDYGFASTVHKAQGSTYHTAFVDYRDLMACRGPERQALLYVAVTRPSRRLAMLT